MNKRIFRRVLGLVLAIVSSAMSQTRIDLRQQSRRVDFSAADATKPAKTGAALPTTCQTGEMFVVVPGVPGTNVFVCVATNIWAAQGGAQSSTQPASLTVERTSDAMLSIQGCSAERPCGYAFGLSVARILDAPTITVQSGSGTILGYLDRSNGLVIAAPATMTVSCSGCTLAPGIAEFPWDSIPQFRWAATSGVWDQNGVDLRAAAMREILVPGENISIVRNGDATVISAAISDPGSGSNADPNAVASSAGSSVDGEIALFDGTTGKAIKRATGSGFVKTNTGVFATAASIAVSDIAAADKQGNGSKIATAGTVTPSRCAEWDASGKLVSSAAGCGSGTVDPNAVASSTATSTDGQIVLFDGTTGKSVKRATTSGFVKTNGGVFATTASITASDIATADKQGDGVKIATAGTATPGRCVEWDASGKLVSSAAGCGSGTVDPNAVASSTAISTDGQIVLFDGTTGKTVTRATTSGFVKTNAGVFATAASIAASDIAAADKQGDGSKIATAGTVTPSRCAEWDASGKLVSSAAACGAGGGAVDPNAVASSAPSSPDGQIVLFDGTTGKTVKRATTSGFVKTNAGVFATAASIAASDIAAADKQGNGTKLATAGTVTPSRCAEWDASGKLVSSGAGCGSGTVDPNTVASSAPSSTDGQIALFDGTTGKTVKRATTSGFVKTNAGVFATAASIAASDIAAADKQGDGAKIATAGTVTPSRCAEWDASGKLVSSAAACGAGGGASGGIDYVRLPAAKCQNGTAGAAFSLPLSNSAVPACVTAASGMLTGVLQFSNTGVSQAQDRMVLHSSWIAPLDVKLRWRTSAVTGVMRWRLETSCVGDGESVEGVWNAVDVVSSTASGTANAIASTSVNSVTTTGCQAGETLYWRLSRDKADTDDTLAAVAELLSVEFTARRN